MLRRLVRPLQGLPFINERFPDHMAFIPMMCKCVNRGVRSVPGYILFGSGDYEDLFNVLFSSYSHHIIGSATRGNALSRGEVIESYFNLGFGVQEIQCFVPINANVHGMCMSLRHLKRRLGCRRLCFKAALMKCKRN